MALVFARPEVTPKQPLDGGGGTTAVDGAAKVVVLIAERVRLLLANVGTLLLNPARAIAALPCIMRCGDTDRPFVEGATGPGIATGVE